MGLVSDAINVLSDLDLNSEHTDVSEWEAAIRDDAEPSTDDVSLSQLMSSLSDCQRSIMVVMTIMLHSCCLL